MINQDTPAATWAEIVKECGFKNETEAQRFAKAALQKMQTRMKARSIIDYQAPERETTWDKLANS